MSQIAFLEGAPSDAAGGLGAGLDWVTAKRAAGWERFQKFGLPTPRLEGWKYTRLRPLDETTYKLASRVDAEISVDDVPSVGSVAGRLVFVNGRLSTQLSDVSDLPEGVRFCSLETVLQDDPAWLKSQMGLAAGDSDQAMLALNEAMMDSGFVLHVPRGVVLTKPLEVVYIGGLTSEPVAYFPRNLIVVDEAAQATLVKHHAGRGIGAYFANAVTEVVVGDAAVFKHYKVQAESLYATHVTTLHATVGRDATYESFALSVGGLLSRTESMIKLAGTGAHAGIHGAYLMRGKEHCDNTSLIDMAVPHTTCNQVFKGVLDDESRAVFQGKIFVAKDAQKADGRMLNKTLLLSNDAEIDSKPELEIYADDVQCAHGATSGQMDDTSLFYLRSRGIPEALARNMLVQSFLVDALAQISDESVKAAFNDRILHWLPAHCYLADEWKESA